MIGVGFGGGMEMMIATLLSSEICKRLKLENQAYNALIMWGMISLINYVKSDFEVAMMKEYISVPYIIATVIVYLIYNNLSYITSFYKRDKKDKMILNIYNRDELYRFKKYIGLNPEIFGKQKEANVGDFDIEFMMTNNNTYRDRFTNTYNNIRIGEYDKSFKFHDTNYDIYGEVEWKKQSKTQNVKGDDGKETQTEFFLIYPKLTVFTDKSKYDVWEYLTKMKEFIAEKEKNDMVLYHTKVLLRNDGTYNHTITIYEGKPLSLKEKESMFMDSFFHKEKIRLWNFFKKLHYEPKFFHSFGQNPRMNILLHGPPGSGKSSFIYRLARCLDRHIISIDLRHIRDKANVYQIIQKPNVDSPNENCIIVLEEIDIALVELYKRYDRFSKRDELISKYYEEVTKKGLTELNNDDKKKGPIDYETFGVSETDFSIRDLLDVFQGTVPINGSIIVATTNKFDEIFKMCPELFRSGRMTPIYFGYLGKKEISNMCQYYFGKPLEIEVDDPINIQTSALVEKALEIKINYPEPEEAFQTFQNYIRVKS